MDAEYAFTPTANAYIVLPNYFTQHKFILAGSDHAIVTIVQDSHQGPRFSLVTHSLCDDPKGGD